MCIENNTVPLLQRMEKLFKTVIHRQELYVPIRDISLYEILRRETGHIAVQHDDSDLLVIIDSATASKVDRCDDIAQKAQSFVVVNGDKSLLKDCSGNCVQIPCEEPLHQNDRVFLLLSRTISLALFGQCMDAAGEKVFQGGWTVQRSTVVRFAGELLGPQQIVTLPEISPSTDIEDRISSAMMRLTALHAGALESREHSVAVEKNDLLSVLDILKAISAERQARNILFVFVEQIARIIPVDRCSIVRILDGEKEGAVLVSHENEALRDCVIQLDKYPELTSVVETGEMLAIDDVSAHPLMGEVSGILQRAGIMSLLVLPIVRRDAHVGTLILRAARRHNAFTLREISFFQIVTEAAANALERAHLFESIQVANERLEQLAITDSLTGIYNRRYFHERLEHEFERAVRYSLPFSCVLFDIDDFKQVNDTFGHLIGDEVLKEVAQCMISCTRRVDILARYGGEEFVILLPQTDLDGATTEAERIRSVFEKHSFSEIQEARKVTISVGVAALDASTMKVSNDLLNAADMALYEAKNSGKNRVVIHQNKQRNME
jgi:two-component system, cell cycle response regulator